jgi:hypothetical protein
MLSEAHAERPKPKPAGIWMGGRAVEGTGLENRQGRKSLVGSNPTPSATFVSNKFIKTQGRSRERANMLEKLIDDYTNTRTPTSSTTTPY